MLKFFLSCLFLYSATLAVAQANIGITVQDGKLFPQVIGIAPGSPAERAGIPLNGIIMRINGQDGFLMKAKDLKKRLNGSAGEFVQLIVTGVYRTDTFNVQRALKSKKASTDTKDQWQTTLGGIFTQLQADPAKLKGTKLDEGRWMAKKILPESLQCYFENDTTREGQVEPIYRAMLAETDHLEDVALLEDAFNKYKPLLADYLIDWKVSIKPDETYQINFDHYTWKKGNTIVSLYYNPNNGQGQSLELKIVSAR